MFQHVRNAARTEGHRFHPAGHDVAFVDHSRLQVAGHINGTGSDQFEAPRYATQYRQRAVGEQLCRIDVGYAGLGGIVKDFGQVWASTALIVHRSVQLVDDHAGDVFVLAAAEAAASQLDALFQLSRGIIAQCQYKYDFRIQGLGDFIVERVGELVFTGRHQAFDQHHFRVFGVLVIARHDLFHQHVLLVGAQQAFNVAHAQRFGRRDGGVAAADDGGGLVERVAAGAWLSDRFEHAQANAFLLHGADDTQADAGQADAGAGGDQHNCT
ncbi:hypothetical protein D3C73_211090 [compost metagenome]